MRRSRGRGGRGEAEGEDEGRIKCARRTHPHGHVREAQRLELLGLRGLHTLAEAVDVVGEDLRRLDRARALRVHRAEVVLHPRDGLRGLGHMLGALLIPRGVPLQLGLHDEKLGLGVLDRVPVLRLRLLLRLEPAGLPLEHLVDDLHARDARKDRGGRLLGILRLHREVVLLLVGVAVEGHAVVAVLVVIRHLLGGREAAHKNDDRGYHSGEAQSHLMKE